MGAINIINKLKIINTDEINDVNDLDDSNESFHDMEEIKEDVYVGTGLKRMKGYKCNLAIDELNKKREEFWNKMTNSENNKNWITWKIIRRAVIYDEVRSPLLLAEYNIKCVNGCINHLIDDKGNHYKIPNYCINEPYFERSLNEGEIKENNINIVFYGNFDGKLFQFNLKLSNKLSGKELKNIISKAQNLENNINIRLFEGGIEIKDGQFLYQHKLKDESRVHLVMNRNLDNNP